MKIIVDAFGGDNAPLEILKGCAAAVAKYDINILLVGSKSTIERVANENNIILYHMEIVDEQSKVDEDKIEDNAIENEGREFLKNHE